MVTSNGFSCETTPCTFRMEHKAEFDVTVSKPRYRTFHGHVTHQVSTAGGVGMAGNVLVGGLIGAGVDLATGAMMELKPNPLDVTLEPDATAAAPAPAAATSAPAAPAATSAAPAPAASPPAPAT